MAPPKVRGVHLVGSVPLDSEEDVFRKVCEQLPNRLKRIPDGEPESRWNFVQWQWQYFQHEPRVFNEFLKPENSPVPTPEEAEEIVRSFQNLETHYEDYAFQSYETFQRLRAEEVIPHGVRFQVSLPTPITLVSLFVRSTLRARIEPLYQQAMLKSLRRIQSRIPASDLAIQWDLVFEVLMLEGEATEFNAPPWFQPVSEHIIHTLVVLVDSVADDVEVGLHMCYGDRGHKHLVEPSSLATVVRITNAVIASSKRAVNWIHVPVPKGRTDRPYFAPLEALESDPRVTDIALGLVHYDDLEGSKARIQAAGDHLEQFQIATECGMGRTPREQVDDILRTSAALSQAIA